MYTPPRTSSWLRLTALGGLLASALTGACATTSEPEVPVTVSASGAIEIEGSHWKVPFTASGFDGRTIEVERAANGHYLGKLVSPGRQLNGVVGAYPGAVVMELVPSEKANEYIGLYTPVGGEAVSATFSVAASGRELKCSLEDYRWLREP